MHCTRRDFPSNRILHILLDCKQCSQRHIMWREWGLHCSCPFQQDVVTFQYQCMYGNKLFFLAYNILLSFLHSLSVPSPFCFSPLSYFMNTVNDSGILISIRYISVLPSQMSTPTEIAALSLVWIRVPLEGKEYGRVYQ